MLLTTCEEQSLLGAGALAEDALAWPENLPAATPEAERDGCFPLFVLDADGAPGTIIMGAPYHWTLRARIEGRAAHAGVEPEEGVSAIQIAAAAVAAMPLGRIDECTTANVGRSEGGVAVNIVPAVVTLMGECRSLYEDRVLAQRDAMTLSLIHICPNLEISASVLADIDCFSRAGAFALAGATTMTVDTSINRDLKVLRQIREKLGVELKLMVNEGCLNKCPYRKFHTNLISHKSNEERDEGNAFSFACGDIIGRDAGQIFKSNWIRPEAMRRYEGITSFFKIVGRDMMPSKVLRCTEAYLDESYDGNLFDLLCSSCLLYTSRCV